MANQVINQMLPHMRRGPQVPNEFWTGYLSVLIQALTKIPVYQRTLDKATVDALIKFYESPAGRLSLGPTHHMAESMRGQEWGAAIGQQVTEASQPEDQVEIVELGHVLTF